MANDAVLGLEEKVAGRAFSDPEHTRGDLETLRRMAQQLVDTYEDPVVCDFTPGKGPVCQSDPQGRHFRIYYLQPLVLFNYRPITVVGFFGQKRPGADIRPLIQADKAFEGEFHKFPGLLSLSTVRLPDGDFANLVLFSDPGTVDHWNHSPLHRDLVAKVSPPYYQGIRLNRGVLPQGLDAPEELYLERVRYLDYSTNPAWRAVREMKA